MVHSKLIAVALGLGLAGFVATPTFAQQDAGGNAPDSQGGGRNRGGGQGGGFGGSGGQRMTPEEFRAAMSQRMKEAMGCTDAEWAVLGPKIENLQTLQFQSMAGRFGGGRGGRGGPQAADPNRPSSPAADAARELQTLLDNKDATPEQIKAKITALRDARARAKEELTKAQTELRELLSVRQEAVLVARGMLD